MNDRAILKLRSTAPALEELPIPNVSFVVGPPRPPGWRPKPSRPSFPAPVHGTEVTLQQTR